ncbi:MAG: hypothetical protein NTU74_03770 [Deltaproteobacteria bacterium]|nr:hypothetical protein [Deltaproteobacteria bacterium]
MIAHANWPKKTGISLALLFLAGNLLLLCWYLFFGYKSEFHSDSAAKVLLAREIVETGQYFPHDWNYVNGDLFVLFGHTFIIPLLAFMPAGYLSHAISGLISSVLILSGVWFLTGLTQVSISRRVFIVSIIASGISGCMAENLYGQVSYGVFVYFSCYILFFSYRFLHAGRKQGIYYGLALFCVLCLAFWSNPQRALMSFGIPLLAAIAWYIQGLAHTEFSGQIKNAWYAIVIVLAGFLLGAALRSVTLAGFDYDLVSLQARWLSYDFMLRNAMITPESFLALFGGLPTADGEVVSKIGIYEAARLAAGIALLVLIPYSIHTSLRQKGSGFAFLASFALTALVGVLFVQIATTVPKNDPILISRYFVPSLVLSLILSLSQKLDWPKAPIVSLFTAAVAVCFVTSAYPAFVKMGISSKYDRSITVQRHNTLDGLKDFLLENGLHYGYAKFWNAGVLSVLSDEKLLVRQVVIDQGLPKPDRWLSSNRWYRPSAWQGETFLLLSTQKAEPEEDQEEQEIIDWDLLERYHCKPIRKLSYEGFQIFVFPHNLAKYLSGWDRRYETSESFPASKESLHRTGKFYDNYENTGSALVADKGEVGLLYHGTDIDVEAGTYTVSFDVAVEEAPDGSARLDVAAAPDQRLLAETVLIDNSSPRQLRFTLNRLATLEFRVWSLGNARVVFRDMSIVRDNATLVSSAPGKQ